MSEGREFDVVVFGATGFMGKLLARYLEEAAPAGTRIALAGRSLPRLRDVRDRALRGAGRSWELLEADAASPEAMRALAQRAKVVATVVGPYDKNGRELAAACARSGTHYVDLTGEVLFARWCADELHADARASGAKIVNSCGFDSVPSDLLVLLLAERARADGAGELGETAMRIVHFAGGVSGGTVDSLRQQVARVTSDPAAAAIARDPYALSPDRSGEPSPGDTRDVFVPSRVEGLGWVAPFVMSPYNSRVVRRSNALQGWAYGRSFRYREVVAYGNGWLAPVWSAGAAFGVAAAVAGMAFKWTRWALDRVLPAPGEGPSEEDMRTGLFHVETVTRTSSGARYRATMRAWGDGGYLRTATMLGECALALALEPERLPKAAGVLTSATAIGARLAERLVAQGFDIKVEKLD